MSAVFDDTGNKYLTTTLVTGPTPDDNILIVAWAKRDVGHAVGSTEIITEAKPATESSYLRLKGTTGPVFQTDAQWPGGQNNATQVSNYSETTWYLVGAYVDKSDGGFSNASNYWDGTKVTSNFSESNTATEALNSITIGSGSVLNQYANWPSKVAEVAIFTVLSSADADTIMAALATTTADAISLPSGAVLLGYWPLTTTSQLTATTGTNLTNHGTTTFDADHPSLSGGGGGSFQAAWARNSNIIIGGSIR